ncbi:winged helix-turn-helix domain-containing protein [Nocardia sp. NPDC004860]|uniref:winged helix-turn-helix domain-containing protein n=1 Tax=Nocardia sp. NPDC004860 TaxID=3154557 RepID=UPI0033B19651
MAFVTRTEIPGGARAHRNAAHATSSSPHVQGAALEALDAELFGAPWVLIAEDNTSPARARNLAGARAALAEGTARSIAGRLRTGALVADIDPAQGHPIVGDACAEALVAWCLDHDLPYLVRESGRPGGRHVITVARAPRHVRQWHALCTRLSRQYKTEVDDRTGKTLRLLSAPHRRGLHCPVITCTLTPADFAEHRSPHRSRRRFQQGPRVRSTATTGRDTSRSAREFGRVCAMARAGYTATQAWRTIAVPGSKAIARGRRWWQRYQWLHAVTTVAAERGIPENEAWRSARQACPPEYAHIRHGWWRGLWRRACAEAATARPRRKRLGDTSVGHHEDHAADIAELRAELTAAAAAVLPTVGVRPQRLASATTTLFHLAAVLVTRNGSISVRDLAERTRLDPKTVRAALALCVRTGLVVTARRYAGGASDSHSYGVGPLVRARRWGPGTSPTSCSTPRYGRAHLPRLRAQHLRERLHWRTRCDALALLEPGERLATSAGRVARVLRSLYHQRRWVGALDAVQLEHRRAVRRRLLRRIGSVRRSAWLDWLAQRNRLVDAVDRLYADSCRGDDLRVIGDAADIVHRGLRDRRWCSEPHDETTIAA